jgi:O-succinylbenzoate synthase
MPSPFIVRQLIRVKSVALHRVRLPLVEPFRISNGVVAEKEAILIEVTTDDGVVAWGEASPMQGSFYSADTPDSAWEVLSTQLVSELLNAGEVDVIYYYRRLRELPGDAFA